MADAAPTDSRDAQYYETVGRLEHQLKTTLAGDEESLRNAKTAYQYNNSLISQNEPKQYAANRYRAVNEGVAQSGVNTGRIGGLGAGFLNQRAKLTTGLQEGEGRIHRAEQSSRDETQAKENEQLKAAEERAKNALLKESPNEQPPPGYETSNGLTVPTGTRVIRPQAQSAPPRIVGTSPQPITANLRRQAASRAARRR